MLQAQKYILSYYYTLFEIILFLSNLMEIHMFYHLLELPHLQ